MSLVPYNPREGREIVLQHRNAIVVRDPSSQSLEIRSLSDCPTCHRPLRSSSPERQFERPMDNESYVDPGYFRMLRDRHVVSQQDQSFHNPPSPIRRLVRPVLPPDNSTPGSVADADLVPPGLTSNERNRIRRNAFSPNYFGTFFVEEKELGRGGKGVVLLVRHEIDGCQLGHFACKRVPVGDDHAWLEKVLIEVELLAKLSHPNLVSYRHVWLESVRLTRFGPTVACAFILQQYCNKGDLLHHVIGDFPKEATKEELKAQMRRRSKGQAERPKNLHRRLSFEEIYSLFRDITSGLAYLHGMGYIHRDLKPSNCLLHQEGEALVCLISDFGEVQHADAVRKSTGTTGTISWCAPEVLRADETGRYGDFTAKADVFSLGMILYFMCFGRLPYASANAVNEDLEDIDVLRGEITDWKGFDNRRRERPDLPAKLYQLLESLLDLVPHNRPSAAEVLGAMRGEAGLEGAPRAPRSPSPSRGLRGRRIQNLDSPLPPSTPIQDLKVDPKRASSLRPSEPAVSSGSVDMREREEPDVLHSQASPPGLRHRSSTRSQDRYPMITHGLTPPSPRSPNSQESLPPDTPLLMAPPTSGAGIIRGSISDRLYWGFRQLPFVSELLVTLLLLGLFLMKMIALTTPCLPFMFNLTTGLPLILLAALDLGVTIARGANGFLNTAPMDRVRVGHQFNWGPRTSMALLGLHFLSVWVMARYGLLCSPPPDGWTTW